VEKIYNRGELIMPYVVQERRAVLDKVVDAMIKANIKADGDLNYVLFRYCKYNIEPRYNSIKNFNGELNEAAAEIRRKILGPYEERKEIENGGI
jgi:hypothetical protein